MQLAAAAQRLLARLDPDGPEPKDEQHRRRRSLTLHQNPDGSADLSGRLTPATAVVWQAILDALAAPIPAQDGTPDPRTPAQRRHDAFQDAGLRLLQSGTLPDCGGVPVTVVATMTAEDLRRQSSHATNEHCGNRDCGNRDCGNRDCGNRDGRPTPDCGYATTAYGGLLSIAELLSMAVEAEIIPVVLSDAGGVLAYGRTRRVASPAQRRALAARDRGCSFAGCTRPPAWCQAHHVRAWIDGGNTDVAQLTLLCGYHHREFGKRGWRCHMINGVPNWTAPPWLDPDQIPRRNTAHHVEIPFDADPARTQRS